MVYSLIFVLAFLFNLYIIVLDGKKDLQKLKEGSIKKYLAELKDSVSEVLGQGAKYFWIGLVLLAMTIVFFNAMFFLGCLLASVLGIYAAKKAHQVPFSSNIINKAATYINRLR